MKKKRFTEQQIIGFLKESEAGVPVKELCRKHGFSDAAFYKWRGKYGGMQVSEAKRLRELEVPRPNVQQVDSLSESTCFSRWRSFVAQQLSDFNRCLP